jgi:Alginate lyase
VSTTTIGGCLSSVCLLLFLLVCLNAAKIQDEDFRYGDEAEPVAIYRLIGNDMPPLQKRGQLRWNTQYALDNEKWFHGATKRWILNRIWNETEFTLIYGSLIKAGVHRRDILARCFDIDEYMRQPTVEDKLFYLTSQNEGRNDGIIDGRNSGFEWSAILDGNTFITEDSWEGLRSGLEAASEANQQYLKIPYHRVHEEQSDTWLNASTKIATVLQFAPTKGESQIAFHKTAKEMFTLGDTNRESFLLGKTTSSKGYGQRNKSYMFKDGEICGEDSKICGCVKYKDANEQDLDGKTSSLMKEYTHRCGLVLRLWNYPADNVIHTGLTSEDEEGFFCFLAEIHDQLRHEKPHTSECHIVIEAVVRWADVTDSKRKKYLANAAACKQDAQKLYLTNSCFRAEDRDIAQELTNAAVKKLASAPKKDKLPLCQRLRPPPDAKTRRMFLTVFNETTLASEKATWNDAKSAGFKKIEPLIDKLLAMADGGLKLGPYSVMDKKRIPKTTEDKHNYYSPNPYMWPLQDCSDDVVSMIRSGALSVRDGSVYREGMRYPGTMVGGKYSDNYDRSRAGYLIDNVTTLALAWHFTGDQKYSKYGAKLVKTFFLDASTSMYPLLKFAHDGERTGLADWKDIFYLTDAFTLLERSGSLSATQADALQIWCAKLARWIMNSKQGHEETYMLNNQGLYADQIVLSLSVYAQDDDLVDIVRSRLRYRLSKPYPLGHFDWDGSQPYETPRLQSLHLITYNLAAWVHVATINEAVRQNAELPYSMESLAWVRHEGDSKGDPVLMKAIRWFSQWLPPSASYYERWTDATKGMHVDYPYTQENDYAFDRMLEIINFGVGVYGVKRLFGSHPSDAVNIAVSYSRYSTKQAMMNQYSSIDPDSGTRAWPGLGGFM